MNSQLDLEPSNIRMYDDKRDVMLPIPPTSLCPDGGCFQCVGLGSSPSDVPFSLIYGNLLIGGVFPIHSQSDDDPLQCGDMTQEGVLLSQV